MSRRAGLGRRLLNRGFRRLYPHDRDPFQYRRDAGVCFVNVQLWDDGQFRASSGVDNHEDRDPTYFKTADEMWKAITSEETAAQEKMKSDRFMQYRARLIASHVKDNYGFDDAADVALDELRSNPDRSWLDVARVVAQRIGQP